MATTLNADYRTYWTYHTDLPSYPPYSGQGPYDVAVIGGGITGLTTALLLKEAGQKVAVLERLRIGSGTTGATTAHITSQIDYDYFELEKNFGKEGSHLAREAMTEGIHLIESITKKYKIDCDFQKCAAYYYTEKEADIKDLEKEFDAATSAGLKCQLVDRAPLPFNNLRALKVLDQAEFHALKYIAGLARAVDGDGCNIFEDTAVTSYEDGEPCTIEIGDKVKLKVPAIVMATQTVVGRHILNTCLPPYRSYVIACKIKGEYPKGLFFDTEDPYFYTRSQPDGKDDHVLLVGGCDHKTAHASDENESYAKLEQYIRQRYTVESIHSRWSSQYYESNDGLPYVGKLSGKNRIYVACGYYGDGITWGSISSKIIADQILHRGTPYGAILDPSRIKPIAGAKDFVLENIDVALQYAQGWLRHDNKDTDSMQLGEARVVQSGMHKVAIYKDENGRVHKCSAVCSHLKAIVKWNSAEKTWDCPAHGGRYTRDGKVICGPPMHDLEDLADLVL